MPRQGGRPQGVPLPRQAWQWQLAPGAAVVSRAPQRVAVGLPATYPVSPPAGQGFPSGRLRGCHVAPPSCVYHSAPRPKLLLVERSAAIQPCSPSSTAIALARASSPAMSAGTAENCQVAPASSVREAGGMTLPCPGRQQQRTGCAAAAAPNPPWRPQSCTAPKRSGRIARRDLAPRNAPVGRPEKVAAVPGPARLGRRQLKTIQLGRGPAPGRVLDRRPQPTSLHLTTGQTRLPTGKSVLKTFSFEIGGMISCT